MKKFKLVAIILTLVFIYPVIVYASNRPEFAGQKAGQAKELKKIEKVEKSRLVKDAKGQRSLEKEARKANKAAGKLEKKANKLTGRENALTRGKGKKIGLKRVVSDDAQGNYQPGKQGRENAISRITSIIEKMPKKAYDGLVKAVQVIGRFFGVVSDDQNQESQNQTVA
jgi:hypothetical protein